MTNRRALMFLSAWACGCATLAASPRLGIIADEPLRPLADVLTAELSKSPNVEIVERSELERILAERNLPGGTWIQIGELAKANGLIIFHSEMVDREKITFARLVAVQPGAVISELVLPESIEPNVRAKAIVERFAPLFEKLSMPRNEAMPVSIVGYHAVVNDPALIEIESGLGTLLARRLIRERNVFVLERQRLESVDAEHESGALGPEPFWSAGAIIEGTIEAKDDRLLIKTWVRRAGAPGMTADLQTDRKSNDALAAKLAAQILEKLGQSRTAPDWHPAEEAAELKREAAWCRRAGLFSRGIAAANASWILGDRSLELIRTRLGLYRHSRLDFVRSSETSAVGAAASEEFIRDALTAVHYATDFSLMDGVPGEKDAQSGQPWRFHQVMEAALTLNQAAQVLEKQRGTPDACSDLRAASQQLVKTVAPMVAGHSQRTEDPGPQFRRAWMQSAPAIYDDALSIREAMRAMLADPAADAQSYRDLRQNLLRQGHRALIPRNGGSEKKAREEWSKLLAKLGDEQSTRIDAMLLRCAEPNGAPLREQAAREFASAFPALITPLIKQQRLNDYAGLVYKACPPEVMKTWDWHAIAQAYFRDADYVDFQFLSTFVIGSRPNSALTSEQAAELHRFLPEFAARMPHPSGQPADHLSKVEYLLQQLEQLYPQLIRFDPSKMLQAARFWAPNEGRIEKVAADGGNVWLVVVKSETALLCCLEVKTGRATEWTIPGATPADDVSTLIVTTNEIAVSGKSRGWILERNSGFHWREIPFAFISYLDGIFYCAERGYAGLENVSRRKERETSAELLLSARRQPPANKLETKPYLSVSSVFRGPAGRPCAIVNGKPFFIRSSPGEWEHVVPLAKHNEGFRAVPVAGGTALVSTFANIFVTDGRSTELRPVLLNPDLAASHSAPAGPWTSISTGGQETTDGRNAVRFVPPGNETRGAFVLNLVLASQNLREKKVLISFVLPPPLLAEFARQWPRTTRSLDRLKFLSGAYPKPGNPQLYWLPDAFCVVSEGVWIFPNAALENAAMEGAL